MDEMQTTPVREASQEEAREAARQKALERRRKAELRARRAFAQRRRLHNVLLTGLFFLTILIFFLANLFVKDKPFSDTENRNLAQKPAMSRAALADGSWFDGLTDWYNDQFFARDGWISLNLWENARLGRKEAGGVYLGQDHYLIAAPETPNEAALTRTLNAVNQFSNDHPDIATRLLLVPDAATILADHLPKNAPVRDQLADIAAITPKLSGNIQMLDGASPMSAHAEEQIYYRTDHHWTSLGAYYTFTANAGLLGVGAPVEHYDVYTVTNDFEGTLASKSGSHAVKDSIQVYDPDTDVEYYVCYNGSEERICSLYQSSALEAKDKYTVFFGGNHPLIEIQTTADNGRTLLVFKDSYANCFIQFLVPYYERIVMVDPRYYYDNLDSILNSGVTDLLYLYSADTFLTDTSLADVLEAGAATEGAPTSEPESSPAASPAPSPEPEGSAVEESSALEETVEPEADETASARRQMESTILEAGFRLTP